MTIEQWIKQAVQQLSEVGIATARLDTLVLLEDVTKKDRANILAHLEMELFADQQHALDEQIEQRKQHIPLAYIRGKTEFYGREFIINQDVLEPRPETETMIEILKKIKKYNKDLQTFIDIGTGSGAIITTAALEIGVGQFIGIDIDPNCLQVARKNAEKHKATITLLLGDLLKPLPHILHTIHQIPFVILANLPYVPDTYALNDAAMNEPKIAIFGGEDGLDLYRKMFDQIDKSEHKPACILTESLPFQHKELTKIAQKGGYKEIQKEDFIQAFSIN